MKTFKTAQMTIHTVNGKITCARNNKTGRFVKLSIAKLELKELFGKKIDKQYDFANMSSVMALIFLFVFFMFAFMFKNDGYQFAEVFSVFFISLAGLSVIVAVLVYLFTTIKDITLQRQYRGLV